MKRFEIIKVDAEIQQPTEQTYFLESQVSKPVVGGSYVNKKIILCFLAALSIGMGVHVALATMAIGIPDADVPVSTAKNSSIRRKYNQEANEPEDINAKKPAYAQANSVPFPFSTQLQPFSKNILAGYSSCEDLIQDVQRVLESLANEIVESQRNDVCVWDPNGPIKEFHQPDDPCEYYAYQTNQFEYRSRSRTQMDGVDQAELIKSNGNYVFMGHGREVIVLDSNGTVVDRVEVPPISTRFFVDKDKNSSLNVLPCGNSTPRYRRVVSLLMHQDDTTGMIMLNVITVFPPPWDISTTAFIYKFAGRKLKLVATKDINGTYDNALGIGSNNHIITEVSFSTLMFTYPLYRCDQSYWNTTYEQYKAAAFAKAYETVGSFALDIVNQLSLASNSTSGHDCKSVVQISSMTTGDEHLSSEEKRYCRDFVNQDVLGKFVQVTSIDLGSVTPSIDSDQIAAVDSKAAGAFLSKYCSSISYATAKDLTLSDCGGRYDGSGKWDQYLYLIKFDWSNGIMVVPKAVGGVSGDYVNKFSTDIYEDTLRVVTAPGRKCNKVEFENKGHTSWQSTHDIPSYQVAILQDNGDGELIQISLIGIQFPDVKVGQNSLNIVCLIQDRGYATLDVFRDDREDTSDVLYSFDLSIPIEPKVMVGMYELELDLFSSYFLISGGKGTRVGDFLLTWSLVFPDDYVSGMRVGSLGTNVTVFDIRDDTKANEVANLFIKGRYDWSCALYFEESNKFILPTRVHDQATRSYILNGFIVLNIDIPNQKICITGMVTHNDGQANYGFIWGDPMISLHSLHSIESHGYISLTKHSIKMLKDVSNLIGDLWNQVNLDANCSHN